MSQAIKKGGVHQHGRGTPLEGVGPRFILDTLLGTGTLCEVHAARDLLRIRWSDSQPNVAVKKLRADLADQPETQLSLVQEYCTLRNMAHPGVIRVYDLHFEPFGLCFSMEHLEGSCLASILSASPYGLGDQALPLVVKLVEAVSFVHSRGVAHGDIKPANVFIEPGGRLVLFDFNMARVSEEAKVYSRVKMKGLKTPPKVKGHSVPYASPEQLAGEQASIPGDMFSLCCTVYEMLTGVRAFAGEDIRGKRGSLLSLEKPDILNRSQWGVLQKGLAVEPGVRPDATVMLSALMPRGPFIEVLRKFAFPL